MLRECRPPPSREASYHMLKQSIAWRRPQNERDGPSCRMLSDSAAHKADGQTRAAAFWNSCVLVSKL